MAKVTKCESCGSIMKETDSCCQYCGSINPIYQENKPVVRQTSQDDLNAPKVDYSPVMYAGKKREDLGTNDESKKINIGLLIILFIVCWPVAIIYLVIKSQK